MKNLIRVARPSRRHCEAPWAEGPSVGRLESLKSGRREAGLSRGPTGSAEPGQRDRPSSRAESRLKKDRAAADERSRGRARSAAQMERPADPKEAKPRAAQSAAASTGGWRWLARTGQRPEGAPGTIALGRVEESTIESPVWIGGRVPRRKLIGRLGRCERQVGLRRGQRGRNCPAGEKLRRAESHERCRLAGQNTVPARIGQAVKDRASRDRNAMCGKASYGECLKGPAIRRFERRWTHSMAASTPKRCRLHHGPKHQAENRKDERTWPLHHHGDSVAAAKPAAADGPGRPQRRSGTRPDARQPRTHAAPPENR